MGAILAVTMRYPIPGRARDLAITDFRFAVRAAAVLTDRSGRTYLVYSPIPPPLEPLAPVLDEDVPRPARRLAEWVLYVLWGVAAAAAFWFVFLVPRDEAPDALVRPMPASFASLSASFPEGMSH